MSIESYLNNVKFNNYEVKEEFKTILLDGESTDYVISNYGYVISEKVVRGVKMPHILKPTTTKGGYQLVCLSHRDKEYWKYVHRLVAEAFIQIPQKYIDMSLTVSDLEVNHK